MLGCFIFFAAPNNHVEVEVFLFVCWSWSFSFCLAPETACSLAKKSDGAACKGEDWFLGCAFFLPNGSKKIKPQRGGDVIEPYVCKRRAGWSPPRNLGDMYNLTQVLYSRITLLETNTSHLKRFHPKRKRSSSKHPFCRCENVILVSGRISIYLVSLITARFPRNFILSCMGFFKINQDSSTLLMTLPRTSLMSSPQLVRFFFLRMRFTT